MVVVVVGVHVEDRTEPRVAKTMRAGGSKVQVSSHLFSFYSVILDWGDVAIPLLCSCAGKKCCDSD